MIKIKYNNFTPNKTKKEEIRFYLLNREFMEILLLTKRYYLQGEHGDYEFILEIIDGTKYVTINFY